MTSSAILRSLFQPVTGTMLIIVASYIYGGAVPIVLNRLSWKTSVKDELGCKTFVKLKIVTK